MYADLDSVEKKYKMTEFPLNVAIEPTAYCNLNCVMCNHDKLKRKKGIMSTNLYKKVIDEIAEENPYTRIWLDYYGEPLVLKYKLFYFIDYAVKKGCKNISFNTNATLLDEEMAEMLLDSGVSFISVDCDGFSKDVYENIRVGANRDLVYRNTEYLLTRREERHIDKPIIEVKIMEMNENCDEIEKVVHYWQDKGAWTCIRRLISWGGAIDIGNSQMSVAERIACGNAVGILPITWDGIATLCVMDVDAQHPCGDISKESIKEVWNRRNNDFVRYHMSHEWEKLPELCRNCSDWSVIGEQRYDEYGNPVMKNYQRNAEML